MLQANDTKQIYLPQGEDASVVFTNTTAASIIAEMIKAILKS